MALVTTMPTNIINPTIDEMPSTRSVMVSATAAPTTAKGNENRMSKGGSMAPKVRTITRYTMMTEMPIERPISAKPLVCCSVANPSDTVAPAGRSKALIRSLASWLTPNESSAMTSAVKVTANWPLERPMVTGSPFWSSRRVLSMLISPSMSSNSASTLSFTVARSSRLSAVTTSSKLPKPLEAMSAAETLPCSGPTTSSTKTRSSAANASTSSSCAGMASRDA